MKEPARLAKQQEINVSPFNLSGWVLLHPTAIIFAVMFTLFICGSLYFAFTGHAAVDSGGMRNFLANGM
ncbi:hypothetical protein [Methanobrevibacter sp.]|uniref:hypothetical protein n=1 Tax=Methanobrevibacter sp. TaxID=66852 RepID=UPI0025E081EA|nr:hypothetical protein [Methanobrevibacter sp.]MBQ6512236.1 hypothetical protein [Methanobrevibacter sp.]